MSTNGQLAAPRLHARLGRALAHRNYRLFFAGQGISLIGTWMTRVATGWLVFSLAGGDAAFLLGVAGFCSQIPAFFLAPLAGVLVDRWDRQRTLLVTQVLAMIQSGLLALITFIDQSPQTVIWEVLALNLFQGFINAFDMPTRQAFVVQMVANRDDLPNAIALNSSLVNGARLVGPSLAGVLIALTGERWCFVVDALSYVAVIASLLAMQVPPRTGTKIAGSVVTEVVEGFRYAFGFAPIRSLLLLLGLASLMGMPYTVLLPIFAVNILGGDAYALGFLTGAGGIGALIGAGFLAARPSVLGLGRVIVVAALAFGLGLIGFSLSTIYGLSLALMLVIGFGMMVQMAACNTILQTIVDEDKRGRVMSFYTMALLGMTPFGSLLMGGLASAFGAATSVLIGGVACVLGGLVFAYNLPRLREHVRPIYARIGILPEMAAGLQVAAEMARPPEK